MLPLGCSSGFAAHMLMNVCWSLARSSSCCAPRRTWATAPAAGAARDLDAAVVDAHVPRMPVDVDGAAGGGRRTRARERCIRHGRRSRLAAPNRRRCRDRRVGRSSSTRMRTSTRAMSCRLRGGADPQRRSLAQRHDGVGGRDRAAGAPRGARACLAGAPRASAAPGTPAAPAGPDCRAGRRRSRRGTSLHRGSTSSR